MRIYLIGMPFSGKTSVGRELAKKLNYLFIDTDETIEENLNLPISEIFSRFGETYFRHLESQYVQNITECDIVVATGGGLPCYNDNIQYLNTTGVTVFLNTPLEILLDRAKSQIQIKKRPHWSNLDENDIWQKLNLMFEERLVFYRTAHIEYFGNDIMLLIESLKSKSGLWKLEKK